MKKKKETLVINYLIILYWKPFDNKAYTSFVSGISVIVKINWRDVKNHKYVMGSHSTSIV